jgi:hypothetical protein
MTVEEPIRMWCSCFSTEIWLDPQFGNILLETAAVICWLTSISSFEVLEMTPCGI